MVSSTWPLWEKMIYYLICLCTRKRSCCLLIRFIAGREVCPDVTPGAERRCARAKACLVHKSKSTRDGNIPQMCEGWSLLTQRQRWMLCGWACASLIFVLERLVHIRVTHSGLGYIKEEHTLLAWLQSSSPITLFFVHWDQKMGWTRLQTDVLPKMCKSLDLIVNGNVIWVWKSGIKQMHMFLIQIKRVIRSFLSLREQHTQQNTQELIYFLLELSSFGLYSANWAGTSLQDINQELRFQYMQGNHNLCLCW